MKSKIIIPPLCEIPQSYLGDLATTDVLEVQGKECKDGEEAKTEMNKIVTEKNPN